MAATIDGWIHHWGEHRPDHPAIVFEGESISYHGLSQRIHGATARLVELDVAAGDRVAHCGLNDVDIVSLLFASARLGATLVPLNNRLSVGEHSFQITDSAPRVVFAGSGFHPQMSEAADGVGGVEVVDLDSSALPIEASPIPSTGSPSASVLMVYTSGTTGHPKGAVHSQDSLFHTVLNGVAHQDMASTDRVLTSLPLFHVGGLNVQTLPALYVGATVFLQRAFDPGEALQIIRDHRPTQTLQVPATMSALLAHPDLDQTDMTCLRGMNSGSSVVPSSTIRRFGDLGVRVGQVYGATETGPTAIVLRYEDAERIGSCGKPALHTEMRLVDPLGADVDDGAAGEVWLRGRNLFTHYWNQPEQTSSAFVDGWYCTGDVGRRDDEGFVFIEDRVKDMLISGGENVYPAEVENVLIEHPALTEVAVLGRAHERWGEVPVAVVAVAAGHTAPDVDELGRFCDGALATFKRPKEIVVVDALPRTALGKVTKHRLRATLGFDAESS